MEKDKKYHVQLQFTHHVRKDIKRKIKHLFINKEFVEFIEQTIISLPMKDKLATLYFFKKLAVQTWRQPCPEHFKAFEDEYLEYLSEIADEQKHYDPIKWISAEIDYLTNTAERLTANDVNQRLNIMQDAKEQLSKDWLTANQVMELLGISKSTLNRRRSEGMPHYKKGKSILYDLKEISQWIKTEAA